MQNFKLSNSGSIPCIGLGTYKMTDENELYTALNTAFEHGYTMIDTAYFYKNEDTIGKIIKNKKRSDIILATKVWPSDFGYDNTMYSIERSLKSLQTDYIDIMYIHWPGDDMEQSWKAFEKMYDEKVIKNLAVANFLPNHYEKLTISANIKPVINQIELHPYNQSTELTDYFKSKDIQIVSWSPLAKATDKLLNEPILREIAKKYDKSISQIVLRWHIQQGFAVIPKTKTPHRVKENIDIFDFELDNNDMKNIKSLDEKKTISHSSNEEDWLKQLRYGN